MSENYMNSNISFCIIVSLKIHIYSKLVLKHLNCVIFVNKRKKHCNTYFFIVDLQIYFGNNFYIVQFLA